MKKQILSFVMILVVSSFGRIIYVPDEYATIQGGIDASIAGDTVLVAPGEYAEVFNINGKNILLASEFGPDTTIIRGRGRVQGVTDSTCIIRGFTIQGDGTFASLLLLTQDSSPKLEGDIFRSAFHASLGGAIDCFGSNPIIRNNIFRNNHCDYYGGAISFEISSPHTYCAEISYNIFHNNYSRVTFGGGYGGAIHLSGNAIIKFNLIFNNEAYAVYGGAGGGLYIDQFPQNQRSKTVIMNNTIVNNRAITGNNNGIGGGLYLRSSATDTIAVLNNIFAFNTRGGNIIAYINDSAYCYWDYNLIYGDTISIFPLGRHDITRDPSFYGLPIDDYSLNYDSPCIDAGDPSSPLDPDSTRADIGALFYDQSVGIDDDNSPSGPYSFELHQNYPNPFNAQTTISYNLPKAFRVSLRIYDLTGRVIRRLIRNEYQSAGPHRLIWDGADESGRPVATAIYLYELKVEKQKQVKAMIMIR